MSLLFTAAFRNIKGDNREVRKGQAMQSERSGFTGAFGIDIGGTFTDIVYYKPLREGEDGGVLRVHKVPSTPHNPAEGLLRGVADLEAGGAQEATIIHGST